MRACHFTDRNLNISYIWVNSVNFSTYCTSGFYLTSLEESSFCFTLCICDSVFISRLKWIPIQIAGALLCHSCLFPGCLSSKFQHLSLHDFWLYFLNSVRQLSSTQVASPFSVIQKAPLGRKLRLSLGPSYLFFFFHRGQTSLLSVLQSLNTVALYTFFSFLLLKKK